MRLRRAWVAFLIAVPGPACVGEPASPSAGQETGPCIEGQCFDGLACLSDICVGDDPDLGESGVADGGETEGDDHGSQDGSASASVSASDSGPNSDSGPGSDSDSESESDLDSDSDSGSGGAWGTCDELDILFVVDNSASMLDEQGRLTDAAPGFLEEVVARSASENHHVMVVDTDAWVFGGCDAQCNLLQSCLSWEDYVCGETQPLPCEDVLGAGVTHPRGTDGSNTDCGFPGSDRFVTLSDPGALEAFTCAATVGTGSSMDPELPMAAMITAVNPTDGGALVCNASFLREDAPLVIVFVTDEDDGIGDSPGTPEGWVAGLAAAKGGDSSRIAVLGLFGDEAICGPFDGSDGAEPSERLDDFVAEFGDRGVASSVCASSYDNAFDELLDVLDAMCD